MKCSWWNESCFLCVCVFNGWNIEKIFYRSEIDSFIFFTENPGVFFIKLFYYLQMFLRFLSDFKSKFELLPASVKAKATKLPDTYEQRHSLHQPSFPLPFFFIKSNSICHQQVLLLDHVSRYWKDSIGLRTRQELVIASTLEVTLPCGTMSQ